MFIKINKTTYLNLRFAQRIVINKADEVAYVYLQGGVAEVVPLGAISAHLDTKPPNLQCLTDCNRNHFYSLIDCHIDDAQTRLDEAAMMLKACKSTSTPQLNPLLNRPRHPSLGLGDK